MKLEVCHFSGYKIQPGRGRKYIRADGKVFNFMNGKCRHSYFMHRNPRDVLWTVLYRRKHKKGTQNEEQSKKRTKRTVKHAKPIQGATLEAILQKRNMKPEVRKAQREQAIKAAREKAAVQKKSKQQVAQKAAQKQQPKQVTKQPKAAKTAKQSGRRY
eukprot:Em0023g658a